jgi:hypothetical protein
MENHNTQKLSISEADLFQFSSSAESELDFEMIEYSTTTPNISAESTAVERLSFESLLYEG